MASGVKNFVKVFEFFRFVSLMVKAVIAQTAAEKFSVIDTPLDEAMPLVDWACTPMGHCRPKEEYASLTASMIHLESLCFMTGCPLARILKLTKSCSAQSISTKL